MAIVGVGGALYIVTIVMSAISSVISFAGCYLYHIYSRDKNGRLLRMITFLVFADGVSSLCFLVWYLLNWIDFMDEDVLCSFIWPIQQFSFLCAFGLIILIANRFKRVNTGQSQKEHLNFPLSIVPLVSFLLTLPTLLVDQVVQSTNITELISNSHEDKNEFCFFNSSTIGIIVNYCCLQLPSLVAIVYNVYAYHQGVESLKASSHEVQKKSRFKASKYLFVLLLVWIPSLIVHAYHSTISQGKEPYYPVLVVILLSSCQGTFNALAYTWEYYPFRSWVYATLLHRQYEVETSSPPSFSSGIFRRAIAQPSAVSTSLLGPHEKDSEGTFSSGKEGQDWEGESEVGPSSLSVRSSRLTHLTTGERSVRFGPEIHHEATCCSVYDSDDDEDEGSRTVSLEETVDVVGKSVFKLFKNVFRRDKKTVTGPTSTEASPCSSEGESEDDEEERDLETLSRNTDINSTSEFFTTRRREKKMQKEKLRLSRSRSPSPT